MRSLSVILTALFTLAMTGFAGEGKKSAVDKTSIKAKDGKDAAYYQEKFPEISQEDLVKAVKEKKVFLVDANGKEKYQSGHIPGAVHFSSENFAETLPEDKETLIVAYCGGPKCEAWCKAADDLDAKGYKNIRHFKGGIKGWKEAGLKTDTPKEKKEG